MGGWERCRGVDVQCEGKGGVMAKMNQLTVHCENRPGTLAHICRTLGDAKVNVLGFLATTSNSEGAVHLVVDNVNNAKKTLLDTGLSYTEVDVLHLELPNVPGALGQFAGKLAAKDINTTLGYQTSAKGSRKASVVPAVSDLEQAARVR